MSHLRSTLYFTPCKITIFSYSAFQLHSMLLNPPQNWLLLSSFLISFKASLSVQPSMPLLHMYSLPSLPIASHPTSLTHASSTLAQTLSATLVTQIQQSPSAEFTNTPPTISVSLLEITAATNYVQNILCILQKPEFEPKLFAKPVKQLK